MNNRNQLLADIVASAEQEVLELNKTASTNEFRMESAPYTENPDAKAHLPQEQGKSMIQKLKERSFHNQATYTEDISEINHPKDTPNSVPDLNTPKLQVDKPTHIVKLAHSSEEIISLLRDTNTDLQKTASVEEQEVLIFLEKTASETFAELADLEKTAEEFGTLAAQAFLREFGV